VTRAEWLTVVRGDGSCVPDQSVKPSRRAPCAAASETTQAFADAAMASRASAGNDLHPVFFMITAR
jgi:hypothetical protein